MKACSGLRYMLAPMPQRRASYRLRDVIIGDTRGSRAPVQATPAETRDERVSSGLPALASRGGGA
jgi:hypothetical protein